MARVVVVTEDEARRDRLRESILRSGHAVRTATSWDGLLRELTDPACALLLVDGALPQLLPGVLQGLAASVAHAPEIRTIGRAAPPLAPAGELGLLVSRTVARVPGTDRHELRLLGLGRDTFRLLEVSANADLPVLFVGEAGTGKKRLARAMHRRTGAAGSFVEGLEVPEGPPGTLYIAGAATPEQLGRVADEARERRWRVCAGVRHAVALPAWRHLPIAPLRERPEELRKLLNLYLERYRRRLGLPRRRLDRALWRLVRRHRWPGNARELEGFVVQCLTSTTGGVVRAAELPERVRRSIDRPPDAAAFEQARGLEHVVEERLTPLVDAVEPAAGIPVHRLAVEATERALIRLALRRTGGDQKAAAELLGVARNTLRAKGIAYGLIHPRRR